MTKLPDNAKKVFKGVLFDVYHWEQKMFDGSTNTFEAITRLPSVSVITVIGDKILLSNEEQPHIGKFTDIQGGCGDNNEEPLDTAKRELLEETGYTSDNFEVFYHHPYATHKLLWPYYIYIAKSCKKIQEQNIDVDGERIELYEVSFEEFLEEVEKPEFRNQLLKDMIFRIKHTPGKLEEFKKQLFG